MIEARHLEELNRIVNSLNNDGDELVAFTTYIGELCRIPDQTFSLTNWPIAWRKKVYEFGSIFHKKNAGPYLTALSPYLGVGHVCEIAAFFNSEIIWNYYEETAEYNRDTIREYIKSFPHNPEFHNTYAIFLVANYNFKKALFEHEIALRADNENGIFLNNYFLGVKQYFELLLRKKETNTAENLINETLEFLNELTIKGINKWDVSSKLSSLRDRLNDHQIVKERVEFFEKEIEAKIRNEHKRLIEVLGIFSAITAFILTNITIALTNLTVTEVLILMLGMALVLIIFGITISFLFSARFRYQEWYSFLKERRFWAIVVLLIGLLVLLHSAPRLSLPASPNANDFSNIPASEQPPSTDTSVSTSTQTASTSNK